MRCRLKSPNHAQTLRQFAPLCAAALAAAGIAGPAQAGGKRNPAPIVYQTGGDTYPVGTPQFIEPARSGEPQGKSGKRIEFRYPGQASTLKAVQPTAPSWASEPMETRQFASAPAPVFVPPVQRHDPALLGGSFDARTIASQPAPLVVTPQVETEPLAPVAPAPGRAYSPPPPAPSPGVTVVSENAPMFDQVGVGVVYGSEFDGLPTANGEMYDPNGLTAAHPSLPLPSLVQVVNQKTGQEVVVRVNDRGPFEDGAILQLSGRAAQELGMSGAGQANLRVRYLGSAPALDAPYVSTQALNHEPAPQAVSYGPAQETVQPAAWTPPAAAAPVYQPASYAAGGGYFVQLGSFSDIANAQALSNSVDAALPVEIVPARVNGADYFRVRVGPVSDRNEADSLRDRLSYSGFSNGRVVAAD